MTHKLYPKHSATRGTKPEVSVSSDFSTSLTCNNKDVRYPLSDSAQKLLTKLAKWFEYLPEMESRLCEFTPEDQKDIVSWANELAYEPTVSQFLIPDNEEEEKKFDMYSWVASYIREYEDAKYAGYIYE